MSLSPNLVMRYVVLEYRWSLGEIIYNKGDSDGENQTGEDARSCKIA